MNIFNLYNFPVNDDWIFVRQVEAFSQGNYTISANIDPTFILQGLLGQVWGLFFGVSFSSLWILTIIITLLGGIGLYKIVKALNLSKKLGYFVLIVYLLNPVIFTSSFSFMTDNYYLTFFIWSLYFYIKYFSKNDVKWMVWGSLFVALSMLIRQVGLVIFIAFLITEFYVDGRKNLKSIGMSTIPIILVVILWVFWPRYGDSNILQALIEFKDLHKRVGLMSLVFPYFGFFLAPALVGFTKKLNWKVLGIISLVLWPIVYKFNVFAVGNVFYIEGLMTKSNFGHNLSLVENIPLAIVFSAMIAFCSAIFLYLFEEQVEKVYEWFELDSKSLFISLVTLGSFFSLIFVSDFYERYFIPTIICGAILLLKDKRFKFNLGVWVAVLVLGGFALMHQIEFLNTSSLMWKQARAIQTETGRGTSIYVGVGNVYTKYVHAEEQEDYTGLIDSKPGGLQYKCFVQQYTVDTDSKVLSFLKFSEDFLEKYTDNPRIYDSRKDDVKSVKKHLNELMFNENYTSPKFNLIGKKAFVGSWCDEE